MTKQKYSGFAIAGFILALFGLFFTLFAVLGVIFSAIGLSETKKHKKKGRGLAIAGLIISIFALFISLIVLIVIMGLMIDIAEEAGSILDDTEYQSGDASNGEIITEEKIQILDHKLEEGDYGTLTVTGTAENVAGKQLSYAEIRVKFYDKDDALIDTSFDNINDLGVGEKWKFEVLYFSLDPSEVDSYTIGVGTIF